jgi:hypothetical protein
MWMKGPTLYKQLFFNLMIIHIFFSIYAQMALQNEKFLQTNKCVLECSFPSGSSSC